MKEKLGKQIMQLWHVVILFLFLGIHNVAFAQNEKIALNVKNIPLRQFFDKIEAQSEYRFTYRDKSVDNKQHVTYSTTGELVETILKNTLTPLGLQFQISQKSILITNRTDDILSKVENKTHSGTVTDSKSEPVIGATVAVKNSSNATMTDASGKFFLSAPADAVLTVSYLGYETQEINVNGKTNFTIQLQEVAKPLDEVIIIGYGVVKKRDLTGSVVSVKADDMNMTSNISIGQSLKGKAAGLSIIQNSAQPGGGLDILIRGGSGGSQYTDKTPLYVVDGVPVIPIEQPESGNERMNAGTQGVLNFINPNDIASIEVLKDASATAIYGARAANGVVLITTQRGTTGKPLVNYTASYGVQKHSNIFDTFTLPEWMKERNTSTWDYWMFENEVIPYGARTLEQAMQFPKNGVAYKLPYNDNQIAQAGEGTDWVSLVTRLGSIQQQNLSIRGGTDYTQYMLSLNYFDHKGIIKNSEVKRYSVRINLDQKINDIFKTGVNVTLSRMDNDNTPLGDGQWEKSGLIRAAVQMGPHIKAIDEDGNYPINPLLPTQPNPYSLLTVTDKRKMDRLLGNVFLIAEPIKELVFKANIGTDLAYQSRNTYMPKTTLHGNLGGGVANINMREDQIYLADINGTYKFKMEDIHNITLMAGASSEKRLANSHGLGNNQFLTDGFKWYNLQSGEGNKTVSSGGYEDKVRSVFSRINYILLDRYLLTATLRADGASVFAKNHKWGYFPSVAFAWNMAEESFMDFAGDQLDMLKLRLSYGQTGNAGIQSSQGNAFGAYYAASAWNDFNKNPQTGVFNSRIENPNLKWETTTVYNAGVDVLLFKGKINLVFDYFDRVTSDLLYFKALNSYHDVSFVMDNIGKTQGRGFEVTLNTKNITRRNFTWATDFTFSLFDNRWLERSADWKPNVYENVNDPQSAYYDKIAIGILQTDDPVPAAQPDLRPGQIIIKDINGYKRDLNGDPVVENGRFILTGGPDGIIDEADNILLGTSDPGPVIGFTNWFTYKNFDFSFDVNGMFNRRMMDPTYMAYGASADGIAQYGYNGLKIVQERWMPDKPSTTVPSSFYGWSRYGYGDWFYQDAWYIRLQSISLGYTLPIKGELKKVFSSVRIFGDANNLYVFTPYKGLDPETDAYAAAYPNARTYTIGIDVKF
ncbi:MAG: TonB-dependent receptor [Prevotellaceae bacterium]|jgi:TonB-linked SusC/RagA family outer membrane protein|nr:TonB-dependent receptor [Prevotellaceae bacterium]